MLNVIRTIRRTATALALIAATGVGLQAQSDAPPMSSHPTLDLRAALSAPLNLSAPDSSSSSSSSVSDAVASSEALTTERLSHLSSDATQPPPRRTYSAPHYSDSMHNADGSNKYTFVVGAGFTLPTGGTHAYLTTSYDFQAGAGRNFSNKFAVLAQFDWHNSASSPARSHSARHLQQGNHRLQHGQPGQPHCAAHFARWIQPRLVLHPQSDVYRLQSEKSGAYVVGGVGFYHKTANFTIPALGTYCDPYYGCYNYQANQSIDKYTSNAVGFNGGIGFTYRPSRFAGERFFAEARYVYIANQSRPYSEGSTTNNYYNVFPQNSAKTSYIPIPWACASNARCPDPVREARQKPGFFLSAAPLPSL